jgi:hypothetical protein
MPFRPTKEEMQEKLKRRLETMPEVYEKVGVPTITGKTEKVTMPTEVLNLVYQVLDSNGIIDVDRVKYLNFARRVFRLKLKYSGLALTEAVNRERDMYKRRYRDINAAVLDQIAAVIAGVSPAPVPAGGAPAGT